MNHNLRYAIFGVNRVAKNIINENCGIVIGISTLYSSEITDILQRNNINDYLTF